MVAQGSRRLSPIEPEIRAYENEQVLRLKLRDLAHHFCVMLASKEKKLERRHATVLEVYESQKRKYGEEGGAQRQIEVREWWLEYIVEDKYVHVNVSRHYVGGRRLKSYRNHF